MDLIQMTLEQLPLPPLVTTTTASPCYPAAAAAAAAAAAELMIRQIPQQSMPDVMAVPHSLNHVPLHP